MNFRSFHTKTVCNLALLILLTMGTLRIVANQKNYINEQRLGEPKTGVLFTDFIRYATARKSRHRTQGTVLNYNSLLFNLEKFMEENNAVLYTNSINEEFLEDFILFLEAQDLRQTYIKSMVEMVKGMTRRASYQGYAVDQTYDDVVVKSEDPYNVFLSMNEITRIYYFQDLTKFQRRIRDLFVVGCLTALRYSDYSTLTKDNFQGEFIVKKTKKTGQKVVVPVHDYIKEIYDRYNGEVSPGLTIQHFNRYIKQIVKKVGIDDVVQIGYTKGGKYVTETKYKWELISSHTARRSAATNLYMTRRMSTYEIMSITGHKTERSFFKYIKESQEGMAKRIDGDMFFRK